MLFCAECAVDFDRTGMVVLTVITTGDYESQMIINYAIGRVMFVSLQVVVKIRIFLLLVFPPAKRVFPETLKSLPVLKLLFPRFFFALSM